MTTSNDQEAPVSTDQTPTTGHDHTERLQISHRQVERIGSAIATERTAA